MKRITWIARAWLGFCLVTGGAPGAWAAHFTPGQGIPGTSEIVRTPARTSAAMPNPGGNGPTLDLLQGTVVSVDVARATLVLAGQTVRWHPTQLKVFNAMTGAIGHVTQLQRGMSIRFALEPGAASDRRIVLMYLEAQP